MARKLELLSPARDLATGRAAILAGADAVYIGAPAFGARAAATNSIEDIALLVDFAHQFRARVYVTMNTIVYDNELKSAQDMVWKLFAVGVDALIVQDMAYLKMNLPPIALNASTQCDIRTPQKAKRLADAGFSQLVLPREFGIDEIRECSDAAGVPVEVFVHGALCVSFSGDCHAGYMAMGRSANRGECPQMCRLPYELIDDKGASIAPKRHYLSLRDLCRIDFLKDLADAGASSFKIEGRLKDVRYVTNVTAAYSQALDKIVANSNGEYERSSIGRCSYSFNPDLRRTFNRNYTDYFLTRPTQMASLLTPKWAGMEVGVVTKKYDHRKRCFEARLTQSLSNGDGLGYFNANGQYCGFRLNREAGNVLYPASALEGLKEGSKLYRNSDKAFFDKLDRADGACSRLIPLDITISRVDNAYIQLTARHKSGIEASITINADNQAARSPQEEARKRVLEKTGGTIYFVDSINDELGMSFIPASILTQARRELLDAFTNTAKATYQFDRRKVSAISSDAFANVEPLTYHDNVANKYSRNFYLEHGARINAMAAEVDKPQGDTIVMTTRYCLRRELGACLRKDGAQRIPEPIFLRNESGTYRLQFNCSKCNMHVIKQS